MLEGPEGGSKPSRQGSERSSLAGPVAADLCDRSPGFVSPVPCTWCRPGLGARYSPAAGFAVDVLVAMLEDLSLYQFPRSAAATRPLRPRVSHFPSSSASRGTESTLLTEAQIRRSLKILSSVFCNAVDVLNVDSYAYF